MWFSNTYGKIAGFIDTDDSHAFLITGGTWSSSYNFTKGEDYITVPTGNMNGSQNAYTYVIWG